MVAPKKMAGNTWATVVYFTLLIGGYKFITPYIAGSRAHLNMMIFANFYGYK